MKITWLGHASFLLETNGFQAVTDPYLLDVYPPLKAAAHAIYCSHGHKDHSYLDAVEQLPERENPFSVTTVTTYHDPEQGALRGENLVHCFEAEGKRIVHLGDLGHLLSDEQIAQIGKCDVLLIPVGGFYTIDAKQAKQVAEQLQTDVIVPMHYHHAPYGLTNLGELDDFLSLFDKDKIVRLETNDFEVTEAFSGKILVPAYCPA